MLATAISLDNVDRALVDRLAIVRLLAVFVADTQLDHGTFYRFFDAIGAYNKTLWL